MLSIRPFLAFTLLLTGLTVAACAGSGDGDVGDGDTTVGDGDVGDGDVGDGDVGDGDGDLTSPDHAHVSRDTLVDLVSTLASDDFEGRDEGTAGSHAARTLLIERMEACGIEPGNGDKYEQEITTGEGTNILGLIRGTDDALSDRTIIVSAHYDHIGVINGVIYNGAMDNAVGASIAVQVGCALAEVRPAKSVLVALWDSEEPPTFLTDEMGSEFYGANPTVPLADIDVAIVMDLMGGGLWPGYQGHVAFGAELSPEVAAAFDSVAPPAGLDAYRAGLHLFEERSTGHLPLSDYDAFRNRDVPVLFLTDGTNKHYHEPDDDFEALDVEKMAKEASFVLDLVWTLGNADATPSFLGGAKDSVADAALVHQLLVDATGANGLADTLNLNSTSRSQLEDDRDAVAAILSRVEEGDTVSSQDTATLRTGLQRAQCLAGTDYAEFICNFL